MNSSVTDNGAHNWDGLRDGPLTPLRVKSEWTMYKIGTLIAATIGTLGFGWIAIEAVRWYLTL